MRSEQTGRSGLGGLTLRVQAPPPHLLQPRPRQGEGLAQPGRGDGLPGLVSLSHRFVLLLLISRQIVHIIILSFPVKIFSINIENMTSRVSKV